MCFYAIPKIEFQFLVILLFSQVRNRFWVALTMSAEALKIPSPSSSCVSHSQAVMQEWSVLS